MLEDLTKKVIQHTVGLIRKMNIAPNIKTLVIVDEENREMEFSIYGLSIIRVGGSRPVEKLIESCFDLKFADTRYMVTHDGQVYFDLDYKTLSWIVAKNLIMSTPDDSADRLGIEHNQIVLMDNSDNLLGVSGLFNFKKAGANVISINTKDGDKVELTVGGRSYIGTVDGTLDIFPDGILRGSYCDTCNGVGCPSCGNWVEWS